jgi:hypothetical protein
LEFNRKITLDFESIASMATLISFESKKSYNKIT